MKVLNFGAEKLFADYVGEEELYRRYQLTSGQNVGAISNL